MLTALLGGVLLAAGLSVAAARELKFGHVGEPGSLFDLSANHFAQLANERLRQAGLNDWQVVVFGSSQLGDDTQMLQKLKLGTIDFSLPSTVMSSISDEFGLFEMPYLVRDRAHMRRIEQEIFWPTLAPAAEAKGYRILAVWENGFRHITNNLRPIVVPADLQGLKLRVPKGKWRVKMFESYGASPTPMSFSEVFVALQTGVIDGQENPLAQIWSAKFQEVQKYLSLTGHVYTPAYVTVSAEHFASLPEAVQEILTQAARDSQSFVYETAARLDQELLQQLQQAGMQVNEADHEAFVAASAPVYAAFAQELAAGAAMVERARALAQ
jgi:tripartite ATP-independent transporter DctP family solute receptor